MYIMLRACLQDAYVGDDSFMSCFLAIALVMRGTNDDEVAPAATSPDDVTQR